MKPPTPSSQDIADGSEAAAVRWAEFKQLYERYLDLYAKSVAETAEYNRLLSEKLALEREEVQQRTRQASQQTRLQRWIGLFLVVALLGLTVAIAVPRILEL